MRYYNKDNDAREQLTLDMIKRFGADAIHIARELSNIADALPDISRTAMEMMKRFGDDAVHISREMADITEEIPEMDFGEVWNDIADTIERLSPKQD